MAVRMGNRSLVCALLFTMCAVLPNIVAGITHKVGDSKGWTTGVDYAEWASGKTFRVGDKLVFEYKKGEHNVAQVSEKDYKSCNAENPIDSTDDSRTNFDLIDPGTQYFICGIGAHCSAGGQKLAVTIIGKNDPNVGKSSSSRIFFSSPLLVATSAVAFLFLLCQCC